MTLKIDVQHVCPVSHLLAHFSMALKFVIILFICLCAVSIIMHRLISLSLLSQTVSTSTNSGKR